MYTLISTHIMKIVLIFLKICPRTLKTKYIVILMSSKVSVSWNKMCKCIDE